MLRYSRWLHMLHWPTGQRALPLVNADGKGKSADLYGFVQHYRPFLSTVKKTAVEKYEWPSYKLSEVRKIQ